jgi:putative endonuclease
MEAKDTAPHIRTGAQGESLACDWLMAQGMVVLHRNWRHGRDEIDILARDGPFLVVVEVKTRASDRWGHPESAVDRAKQRKLMRCAEAYLFSIPDDLELRFDVIGVTYGPNGPEVLHIPNAFYPTLDEQTT